MEYQTAFCESIWCKNELMFLKHRRKDCAALFSCSSKLLSKTPATNGQQERTQQRRPPPGANNLPRWSLLSGTNMVVNRWQRGYMVGKKVHSKIWSIHDLQFWSCTWQGWINLGCIVNNMESRKWIRFPFQKFYHFLWGRCVYLRNGFNEWPVTNVYVVFESGSQFKEMSRDLFHTGTP